MRATRWLLELCLQRRKKAPGELRKSETRSRFCCLACLSPRAFPLVLLIKGSPGDKWCPTIDYAKYGCCTAVDMTTGV